MPALLGFDGLQVGNRAAIRVRLALADVQAFGRLVGDQNPLHAEPQAAQSAGYPKPVVHGLYLGGLCSALIGSTLPGPGSVIQSIQFYFRGPAFIDDEVEISVTVAQRVEALRTVVLTLRVERGETTVVTGRAQVGLPERA